MTERVERRLDFGRKLLFMAAVMSAVAPAALGQMSAAQSVAAAADSTVAKLPVYDVVSIKPNKSGSGSVDIESNTNSYSATNISVKTLLENAYDIKPDLISGVPGPIASARFDVVAKISEPDALHKLSGEQWRPMLLPILAERFRLKAHTEIETLPVYELIVIPSGPKFERSTNESKRGGGTDIRGSRNRSELTARDRTMASFASSLENAVHRTVIDKTGLEGSYDFVLTWAPDDHLDTQDDSAPSIFTALPEQLGL